MSAGACRADGVARMWAPGRGGQANTDRCRAPGVCFSLGTVPDALRSGLLPPVRPAPLSAIDSLAPGPARGWQREFFISCLFFF
ncbi:hypothetical protein BDA96_03G038600 [Sorghum bicolor]|uniref:Uncharacterized protein n=1 Tax=Sorghum bicolor TaxID=4558 RepID=A0A921R908_SORBI|nr:hypothetical protein BDA96_03G038600 [Sorghum bicolor]